MSYGYDFTSPLQSNVDYSNPNGNIQNPPSSLVDINKNKNKKNRRPNWDEELATNSLVDGDFQGPTMNRKCTDILFLILLLCGWLAMTLIGFAALGIIDHSYIQKGDPYRLIGGIDYKGNICGSDSVVKKLKKLYYPNSLGNIPTYESTNTSNEVFVSDSIAICVEECPDQTTQGLNCDQIQDPYTNRSWCSVETTDFINYCITTDFTVPGGVAEQAFADIWTAGKLIGFLSFPGTIGLCLLYLQFIRYSCMLKFIIFDCILLVFGILGSGGYFLITEAKEQKDQGEWSDTQILITKWTGYIFAVAAGLWLALVIFLRREIFLAVGIIKSTAKAIQSMLFLTLFPILQTICLLGFLLIWCYYALYLASSGDIEVKQDIYGDDYRDVDWNKHAVYSLMLFVFIYFWTSEFIEAVGQVAVSLSISRWYFSLNKKSIDSKIAVHSIGVVLRYHLGSCSFGGIIIGFIKWLSSMVNFIKKKTQNLDNALFKCMLCCIRCCLWCFDVCLSFLNKNAYIQTAIFGYPFCKAARKAIALYMRNITKIATVAVVGDFVIFLTKISISMCAAALGYAYMKYNMEDDLNGFSIPVFCILVLSYTTAAMFTEVVAMSVDTMIQCFIIDSEMNDGRGRYAEIELQNWMDATTKKKEENAY